MDSEIQVQKEQMMNSIFRAKKMLQRFPHTFDDKIKKYNINTAELFLMKEIENNCLGSPDNVSISDIQNFLFITKAGVSQMLNALEGKGYINRDIDRNNRRKLIITLTPLGEDTLQDVTKVFDATLSEIIARLGKDEINKFIESINRIIDVLKEIHY